MSPLSLIGNTRLYKLRRMAPVGGAEIFLKLEYENPTGSMKDRMALAMVEAAGADGRLLTLEDTVEFFNLVLELKLTEQEKKDLGGFHALPVSIVNTDFFENQRPGRKPGL